MEKQQCSVKFVHRFRLIATVQSESHTVQNRISSGQIRRTNSALEKAISILGTQAAATPNVNGKSIDAFMMRLYRCLLLIVTVRCCCCLAVQLLVEVPTTWVASLKQRSKNRIMITKPKERVSLKRHHLPCRAANRSDDTNNIQKTKKVSKFVAHQYRTETNRKPRDETYVVRTCYNYYSSSAAGNN